MRTIIAGSRGITDYNIVDEMMRWVGQEGLHVSAVVSGGARGVDTLGERWAEANGIEVIRYPADWNAHGKSAGYRRNEVMAQNAGALVAFWDGKSRGTKHMIDIAEKKGLLVWVKHVEVA